MPTTVSGRVPAHPHFVYLIFRSFLKWRHRSSPSESHNNAKYRYQTWDRLGFCDALRESIPNCRDPMQQMKKKERNSQKHYAVSGIFVAIVPSDSRGWAETIGRSGRELDLPHSSTQSTSPYACFRKMCANDRLVPIQIRFTLPFHSCTMTTLSE